MSYSHESAEHKNWVLGLAADLRKRGVDAILDVWDLKLGDDVARFMEHLASVDRVVIVCSEDYARKAVVGKGGVGYETMLVTAEILQDRGVVKFIPVLRRNPSKTLPPFLRTRLWIDFEQDADYPARIEELSRALHQAPANPKPPIGPNPYSDAGSSSRDVFADSWFSRHQSSAMLEVQKRGAFMEVAFGSVAKSIRCEHRALLNVAERSLIHTFGWPIGVVLHVDDKKPKPEADGIVATIASHGFSDYERFDYWALRLNGDFYLAQNLFENGRDQQAIFFNTRMIRTAEALLYCRNLYSNLGVEIGSAVHLRLRHSGIGGRNLSSSNPNRMMWPIERKSAANTSECKIEFQHPLTDRGVVEKTMELLKPLFVLFDYFEPDESIYQDVIGNFIQGRCT
ncbi:MAG: toll/interleukin-1 receptor domain-containing protein [Betaproteobacteria bacterium]|nr:toll/interleukin-1 receptor domain-containing protein [Betaproteobacteria bacterium]